MVIIDKMDEISISIEGKSRNDIKTKAENKCLCLKESYLERKV